MQHSARILLVRHGYVRGADARGEAILLGWTDVDLHPLGIEQARRVAARLRQSAPGAPVYTSPLRRALQTARIIAEPERALIPSEDLREIGCGAVDGMPIRRLERDRAQLWQANLRQDDPDFRWPGGESYRELRARALRALDVIAARHAGASAIAVTHTGVVTQIVAELERVSPARWSAFRVHPASITELRWGRDRALVGFDDCGHLDGLAAA